jgi:uncharacterized protein (TIGR00369 family)
MGETTMRQRTITWDDPVKVAEAATNMAGVDYLNAMGSGRVPIPPAANLVGLKIVEATPGRAVFTLEPAEFHYNTVGVVHGGIVSTLLDTAMGCAVYSMLAAGIGYTTIELHVNFLRAITADTGALRCEGETIHVGRTIATAQGRLLDAGGKLYAHGTTTCAIMRGEGATNPTEAR